MNEFRERTIEQDSTTIDDSFYNVVLFNDDVTPFEYVIMVLNRLFGKSIEEGVQISMQLSTFLMKVKEFRKPKRLLK